MWSYALCICTAFLALHGDVGPVSFTMRWQYHVLTLMNETVDLTKSLSRLVMWLYLDEAGMTIKSTILRAIMLFFYV